MKLKERILILTLCFCAAFAMMCVSASAEEELHSHCVCGKSDKCGESHNNNTNWTGISSLSNITADGNYYLTQGVTLTSTWTCKYNINLCLNGKTITSTQSNDRGAYVIEVNSGASLTITDCQTTVGEITHAVNKKGGGISNSGTLTLWNGAITGNNVGAVNGGVYNASSGTFNMNGGSITNSTNSHGVYNSGGKFNLSGGEISDNIGGVYNNGTFSMTGGFIKKNTKNGAQGGGVFNWKTFTMTGGEISGNTAVNGGGVYNCSSVAFTMTGGSITNNTATGSSSSANGGGGVYNSGTFDLSGEVTISGNTSSKNGGGVYTSGTLNMSGNVTISGNKGSATIESDGTLSDGTKNNVYLYNSKTIAVDTTGMAAGASVGITAAIPANLPNVVTGSTDTGVFTSDDDGYWLISNGDKGLKLTKAVTISGVKLLNATDGTDMTVIDKVGSKVYDGKAVAYSGGTTDTAGVTLSYKWQEKANGSSTYSDITDNAAPTNAGSYKLKVTATKSGEDVGILEIPFTIEQRTLTITGATVTPKTYDGKTDATISAVNFSGLQNNETLKLGEDYNVSGAAYDNANSEGTNKATKVTFTVALKDTVKNYTLNSDKGEVDASIKKATGSGTVTMDDWTYGDTAKNPEPTSTTNTGTVTYKYKVKSATDYLSGVPTNAGKYTVEATFAATDNYTEATATKDFTISPKTLDKPAITVGNCTYNGTEQKPPITVKDGATTIGASEYNVVYNNNINAGNATVKITNKEGGNYTVNGSANFSILRATPQVSDFTFTPPTNLTYDGTAKTATVTANSGITGEVTVSYYNSVGEKLEAAPSSVGTYKVKINVAEGGNYNAVYDITDGNWTFTINKASTSSGGGGGGHSSSYQEITLVEPKGGEVLVSPTSAKSGETVTVTLKPEEGYEADSVTVLDKDGKAIEASKKGDGAYTFTMPAGKASVSATFKKTSDKGKSYVDCPKDATCPIDKFTDAKNTAWYHDGVHYCLDEGLMKGMSDVEFWPNGDVTRAQIVTILWRIEGSKVVNYAMKFKDVASDSWYAEAIRWAASEGVVTGYSDEVFGPNDSITREQLATILHRYAKYKGMDATDKGAALDKFSDGANVSAYALDAVKWAVGSQIINGTTTTTLSPKGTATRAQAACLMQRFLTENK